MNDQINKLPSGDDPLTNKLLAALPELERSALLAQVQPVELSFGQVLYEPYETITHAYFPLDTIVSLLSETIGGLAVEVGIIGQEGMMGATALLEKDNVPYRAVAQGEGTALRIELKALKELATCHAKLHGFLLRYVHALFTQITQSAVCNRFHTVEQRLARWLLFAQERWGKDTLPWTQKFLAQMLGADRASVAISMGKLKKAKIIRQAYGRITILKQAGLKQAACECYQIVTAEFDDFLKHELHG